VVRDHKFATQSGWGINDGAFRDLTDPSDGLPGRIVVSGINIPFSDKHLADFGQERLVGGDISIAVDPQNSSVVYLAYAEGTGPANYTVHVISSMNGGISWSENLRTVTSAKNFSLAINDPEVNILGINIPSLKSRQVGFFYQQFVAGENSRWLSIFEVTSNDWKDYETLVLTDVPAMTPVASPVFGPYLADYGNLVAVGNDFCGIFSANNTPYLNNFPSGVTYQRKADFASGRLHDLHNNKVAPSIDPFFFRVYNPGNSLLVGGPPLVPPTAGPVTPLPGEPVE
jgi:hypothetical protein